MPIISNLPNQHFFKNQEGHIVLIQMPNLLLWVWIVSKVLSYFLAPGQIDNALIVLGKALLVAWAMLELLSGVNYFRRLLGLIVLAYTVSGIL